MTWSEGEFSHDGGNWNGSMADIYCASLFNLMKPDGMQLCSFSRADAQVRSEALEWQWLPTPSCQ